MRGGGGGAGGALAGCVRDASQCVPRTLHCSKTDRCSSQYSNISISERGVSGHAWCGSPGGHGGGGLGVGGRGGGGGDGGDGGCASPQRPSNEKLIAGGGGGDGRMSTKNRSGGGAGDGGGDGGDGGGDGGCEVTPRRTMCGGGAARKA